MATHKQERALQEMVENGGNVTRAMLQAGYSFNTAHTPSKLTRSKAFREFEVICSENGLDAQLIIRALVEDISSKPMNRVGELLLAAKILGLLEKSKQENMDRALPIPIFAGASLGECPHCRMSE